MDKERAASDDEPGWKFKPEDHEGPKTAPKAEDAPAPASAPAGDSLSWTASEYIAHNKSFMWYALLAASGMVAAALAYLITEDIISSVVILFVAAIFGVFAGRKPRVLAYTLDSNGLTIGEKFYPYVNFKSYTVGQEAAFVNITFMPLKRFMPPLSIYVPPQEEDKILRALSKHLPFEKQNPGAVEGLMRRVRF